MSAGRRRAIVLLPEQAIAQLLELPEGAHVIGVQADWARLGISVMIEGPMLEPVPPECAPPQLFTDWEIEYDTDDAEIRRMRFIPPKLD